LARIPHQDDSLRSKSVVSSEYNLKDLIPSLPNKLVPSRALYPVRKAYKEVYDELGPGKEKEQYIEALSQKLKNSCHQVETHVKLRCRGGVFMGADLTYAHRKVYIAVTAVPREISDGAAKKILFRLREAGMPLGIILNFGSEEADYRQVVNVPCLKWLGEKKAARVVVRRKAS
jgi:GxxExxY protein